MRRFVGDEVECLRVALEYEVMVKISHQFYDKDFTKLIFNNNISLSDAIFVEDDE